MNRAVPFFVPEIVPTRSKATSEATADGPSDPIREDDGFFNRCMRLQVTEHQRLFAASSARRFFWNGAIAAAIGWRNFPQRVRRCAPVYEPMPVGSCENLRWHKSAVETAGQRRRTHPVHRTCCFRGILSTGGSSCGRATVVWRPSARPGCATKRCTTCVNAVWRRARSAADATAALVHAGARGGTIHKAASETSPR